MALLKEVRDRQHHGEAMPSAPSIRYLIVIGVVLFGALFLVFAGLVAVGAWIWKSINP